MMFSLAGRGSWLTQREPGKRAVPFSSPYVVRIGYTPQCGLMHLTYNRHVTTKDPELGGGLAVQALLQAAQVRPRAWMLVERVGGPKEGAPQHHGASRLSLLLHKLVLPLLGQESHQNLTIRLGLGQIPGKRDRIWQVGDMDMNLPRINI